MPELRLQQLQFEIDAIKRLLSFMMEENVHLKNRISEILKNNFEKMLLGKIEVFHNRFIMEDEIIGVIRNDIAELDKLLQVQKILQDDNKIHEMGKKIRKLSVNMENTQSQFMLLKTEFNTFLLENTEACEKA
ncbi:hypothetical protein [Ferruginibacter profundus]